MTYEWIPIAAAAIVAIITAVTTLIVTIRQGTRQDAAMGRQDAAIEVVRKDVNGNHTTALREIARHAMKAAVATGKSADMQVAVNAEMNAEAKAALTPPPPPPLVVVPKEKT